MPARRPAATTAARPNRVGRLLYECGANWRYAVGAAVSDPALWYQAPSGRTHALVNELELGHLHGHAKVDQLHGYAQALQDLKAQQQSLSLPALVRWLMAQDQQLPEVLEVPRDFPSGLMVALQEADLPVRPVDEDLFFPQRAIKTPAELKALRAAQALNERAIAHAFEILAEAEIRRDRTLAWRGAPLTSQILQGELNAQAVLGGALAFGGGPIVAGGARGATPHDRGHGVLKADQFIVIDSFPRHANGYWGDCTRTVLKGRPSGWQTEVYAAVLEAQRLALKLIKPGVDGRDIHAAVESFFAKAGFKTGTDAKGRPFGFFHGTGHGVGLELHDPGPRTLSRISCVLKPGMVTSVEPGLYLPGKGGCRIEDVVAVTETGHKNLTKLDKHGWVID